MEPNIGPIWLHYEGRCYGKFMLHEALTHNKYIRDVETKMHLNKKEFLPCLYRGSIICVCTLAKTICRCTKLIEANQQKIRLHLYRKNGNRTACP